MRGTGKTTKLLKATPQGGVFVVQNRQMVRYINDWIAANGRDTDDIKVIAVQDCYTQLRGFKPRPLTIDHCVVETMRMLTPDEAEELLLAMSMAPYLIKSDEEGDAVTIWNGIND